jgi:hypothetical protein
MRRKLLVRLVFVALIIGGTFYWQSTRKPVDMTLAVDLSGARPREISGVDVIVRRGGRPLSRHEMGFGRAGAPPMVEFVVHAAPGNAEIESTLNYAGKPSRRVTVNVDLHAEGSNTLRIE